jgi:hypothetical protein
MSRRSVLDRLYAGPRGAAPGVANPYRDEHPELDRPGGARLRRRNLEAYLEAVGRPRWLLLGEAMGYRGARFSGIAFTSERQLAGPAGVRLGWASGRARPTSTLPALWTEPSGTIVWRALDGLPDGVLLWNTFPWHPHATEARLTNRTPTPAELRAHRGVLSALLDWAQPERVAAVGRVAAAGLGELGVACTPLRHPARGGASLFTAQLRHELSKRFS